MDLHKAKKEKYKVYFLVIMGVLVCFSLYMIGKYHGGVQARGELYIRDCKNPIGSHGCIVEENPTHCMVANCKIIGMEKNAVFCFNFEDRPGHPISLLDSMTLTSLYGCPMYIEEFKNYDFSING